MPALQLTQARAQLEVLSRTEGNYTAAMRVVTVEPGGLTDESQRSSKLRLLLVSARDASPAVGAPGCALGLRPLQPRASRAKALPPHLL